MTGFGGGFFYIPMFLHLNYAPQVANATSLFLIFWSKLATSIIFSINGDMHLEY
jgi:uncharacterized membrane protein YfcA